MQSISESPVVDAHHSMWRDVNVANTTAGITAVLWYAFGAIPVFLGVVKALSLPADIATSWFTIIFLTSVITSVPLTLHFRQPLAIGWTIPGLVLIGAVGTQYRFEEVVGANVVCGVLIIAIALTGIADRLMRWLPLPIILGMFAGSVLSYATSIFSNLGVEPIIVGLAIVGFLGARAMNRP